jgi:hypothetical protein
MFSQLLNLKKAQKETPQNEEGVHKVNILEPRPLKTIFSFLNVIEMVVISRVCSKWKRIIEKNPDILISMNLVALPHKINGLNLLKILTRAQMLKHLILAENMAVTDTLS